MLNLRAPSLCTSGQLREFRAYNAAFGDRRVIAVEIDSRAVYDGTYREPIMDAGTAMLDRLVWVARSALEEMVAELHPGRHGAVAAQVRELIGN